MSISNMTKRQTMVYKLLCRRLSNTNHTKIRGMNSGAREALTVPLPLKVTFYEIKYTQAKTTRNHGLPGLYLQLLNMMYLKYVYIHI